jgi:hypothetical protein
MASSPPKVKAGIRRCAGDDSDPVETTSETVSPSVIGPPVYAGFAEL